MPKYKTKKMRSKAKSTLNRVKKQKLKARRNALVKSILKWDHPKLKEISEPLEDNDNRDFIDTLIETLLATSDGVGLSSPQIGVLKQVIAFRPDINSSDVTVMINPIITNVSEDTSKAQEGCLSFPGIYASVERPTKVTINWKSINGEDKDAEFDGFKSIIIQHEIDHLQGICKVGDFYFNLPRIKREAVKSGQKV